MSDFATDAEIKQALSEGRDEGHKRALADRASREILEGQSEGVVSLVDLYDSEVIKVEKVFEAINVKIHDGSASDMETFGREIRQRFEEIGIVAEVFWYTTNIDEVYIPEIHLQERIEAISEFDQDRQVHEVTNDLLGLGEGGVIGGGLWTP